MGSDKETVLGFSETSVSHSDGELKIGQMISVSPRKGLQFAATVTKIFPDLIWIRLFKSNPKKIHPGRGASSGQGLGYSPGFLLCGQSSQNY